MTLLHSLRRAMRKAGVDVARFPGDAAGANLVRLLRWKGVSMVLDVGANSGGYAKELREFGYTGRIVSFEPLREQRALAERAAANDAGWTVLPYALGPEQATVVMNVAGNAGASSSVLPMHDAHVAAAPQAAIVRTEQVEQVMLDDLWPSLVGAADAVFLKLDVQGYERQVLAGATRVLSTGNVVGLQIETSLIPLYEDAWLHDEVLQWARDGRWDLCRVIPGFTDAATGRMLQADAVFFRG